MSENFEKIVLEKLNKMDNFQTTVLERLDNIENNQQDIYKRLDSIESNQTDFKKKLYNLTIELKDTQEVVKSNRNILLKLETSLQDKVDVLFDYRSINDDKHNKFSKSIKKLQHKTFDHGIRISTLENDLKKVKEA